MGPTAGGLVDLVDVEDTDESTETGGEEAGAHGFLILVTLNIQPGGDDAAACEDVVVRALLDVLEGVAGEGGVQVPLVCELEIYSARLLGGGEGPGVGVELGERSDVAKGGGGGWGGAALDGRTKRSF